MSKSKENVLVCYMQPTLAGDKNNFFQQTTDSRDDAGLPLATLLHLPGCAFGRICLIAQNGDVELAREMCLDLSKKYGVAAEACELPQYVERDQATSVPARQDQANVFAGHSHEYYLYLQDYKAFSVPVLHYLATNNLSHCTLISFPDPSLPGKPVFSSWNLPHHSYQECVTPMLAEEVCTYLNGGIELVDPDYNNFLDVISKIILTTTEPILLFGPHGSGKSTMARRLYELRKLKGLSPGAFVEVQCSALTGREGRSVLFGQRGGISGAKDREGLLYKANNGVLYLKDIELLNLDEQSMLMRFLETRLFYPVGSDEELSASVQLICSTAGNLLAEVRHGSFRMDLLSRITTWNLSLPALRNRRNDIPAFLDAFLAQLSIADAVEYTLTAKARERLLEFSQASDTVWQGNLHEFWSMLRRLSALASSPVIDLPDVEKQIGLMKSIRTEWNKVTDTPGYSFRLLRALLGDAALENMDFFESVQLENVLSVCVQCRNLADAGRRLFGYSRLKKEATNDSDRIRKYLSRYGLSWTEIAALHLN